MEGGEICEATLTPSVFRSALGSEVIEFKNTTPISFTLRRCGAPHACLCYTRVRGPPVRSGFRLTRRSFGNPS